jgi:hypothetical protein
MYSFVEAIGMNVDRSPSTDALVISLNSWDIDGGCHGLVYLRTATTQPEAAWLRERRIRWDERVRLHERLYVVRFGG